MFVKMFLINVHSLFHPSSFSVILPFPFPHSQSLSPSPSPSLSLSPSLCLPPRFCRNESQSCARFWGKAPPASAWHNSTISRPIVLFFPFPLLCAKVFSFISFIAVMSSRLAYTVLTPSCFIRMAGLVQKHFLVTEALPGYMTTATAG